MSNIRAFSRVRSLCEVKSQLGSSDTKPEVQMLARVRHFLNLLQEEEPCLVLDLDAIKEKFLEFKRELPQTKIYYAVKANPAPEILRLLVALGSYFDAASVAEIKLCLAAGAEPTHISYGNTIKKERDIEIAYGLGVRLFTFDSLDELEKIAYVAPHSNVICRILCECVGAQWPLSRKFGCVPQEAAELLSIAKQHRLNPIGISFHVGSQQMDISAWDNALAETAMIFEQLKKENIDLSVVNMGGGFPTKYLQDVPTLENYGQAIYSSLRKHFGENMPESIIEPGRGLVGHAGIIQAEVVLISKKQKTEQVSWVYLDIGKFSGLTETTDEAIRYPIITLRDGDETMPCIVAGPTCDSVDVLYEKHPYPLPKSLSIGDKVWLLGAGAYTTTYSSVAFNGFEPLKYYSLPIKDIP